VIILKFYLLCGLVTLLAAYLDDWLHDGQSLGWGFWRHVRMVAMLLSAWWLCLLLLADARIGRRKVRTR
jgi:hypothetical protein